MVSKLPFATIQNIVKDEINGRVSKDSISWLQDETDSFIRALVNRGERIAKHAGRETLKVSDLELALQD